MAFIDEAQKEAVKKNALVTLDYNRQLYDANANNWTTIFSHYSNYSIVVDGSNNTMKLNTTASPITPITVTIASGTYDKDTICTEVETKIAAAISSTCDVTYTTSSVYGIIYTITCGIPFGILQSGYGDTFSKYLGYSGTNVDLNTVRLANTYVFVSRVYKYNTEIQKLDVIGNITAYQQSITGGLTTPVGTVLTLTKYSGTDYHLTVNTYYDDSGYLYVNTTADSRVFRFFFASQLYFSTFGVTWFRDPLDNTTALRYYEPLIISVPSMKASLSDSFFGYVPSETSNFSINNLDNLYEQIIYTSSFYRRPIKYYQVLGDLKPQNIKLIFDGICNEVKYSFSKIDFSVSNKFSVLDNNTKDHTYYSSDNYTFYYPNGIDPNFIGRPLREIYGRVELMKCVNIDFKSESATTSDNRAYAVCYMESLNDIDTTATNQANNTTTKTYITASLARVNVGDNVRLTRSSVNYHLTVTTVDAVNGFITHSALPTAMVNGEVVYFPQVANFIYLDEAAGAASYLTTEYYTEQIINNTLVVTITSGVEAFLGVSTFNGSNVMAANVYGELNNCTLNAVQFGTATEMKNNAAVACLDLLKRCGVTDSEIDSTSFTDVLNNSGNITFANPKNVGDDFRYYKDIISEICTTYMLRLIINKNNKWALVRLAKITQGNDYAGIDHFVNENEIIKGSFSYNLNHQDIYNKLIIKYNYREFSSNLLDKTRELVYYPDENIVAKYLYDIERQKTIETMGDSQYIYSLFPVYLSYLFGDRQGLFKFSTTLKLADVSMDDIINLDLVNMVGYATVKPDISTGTFTRNSRNLMPIEIEKGFDEINITLFDQKGLQDNL